MPICGCRAAMKIAVEPHGVLEHRKGSLGLRSRIAVARLRTVAEICDNHRTRGYLLTTHRGGFARFEIEHGPRYRDDRSALVTLRRPRPMAWTAEGLRTACGLTAREAVVAIALGSGARPAGIATLLGLTTGFVRIYLKRIFAETGADGRTALVSLLLSRQRAH